MKGEFYKMDFRAWNTGTVDLTLEQEAAYLRLCHAMYDTQGAIPESTRLLQGIFRCGNVKAAALVAQLIKAGKILRTDEGKLTNRRVETELAGRERISEVRRSAGSEGGRARRVREGKNSSDVGVSGQCPPSDPRVTADRPPSDPEVIGAKSLKNKDQDGAIARTPGSREEEIREEKTPVVPKGTIDRFEEFRSAYPRRDMRFSTTLARKRWHEALKRGAIPEQIIAGAKNYAAEQAKLGNIGSKFVKTAEVWLRNELWNDYQPEPAKAASQAEISADVWRERVKAWKSRGGHWPWQQRTEPPDDPRTKVPPNILAEFDIRHPVERSAAARLTGTG